MDDALRMGKADGLTGVQDMSQQPEAFGERPAPGQPRVERFAADELLGTEECAVFTASQLVHRDDARVVQSSDEPHLAQEADLRCHRGHPVRPALGRGRQFLERHLPADDLVAGGTHHALTPSSKLVQAGVLPRTLERHHVAGL
jgi:hypothetical protein